MRANPLTDGLLAVAALRPVTGRAESGGPAPPLAGIPAPHTTEQ
jgi:hypothetical protein